MNRLLMARPTRLFEEMFRTMDEMVTRGQSSISSAVNDLDFAVDVKDEKDHILVRADVPGISKDQLNVTLEDGILTITGERKREEAKAGENYYFRERSYGTYSRSFRVPDVDEKSINATLQNGVLQVILKRSAEAKPRKIEIG